MPTDTQRAPSVRECVEAERLAVRRAEGTRAAFPVHHPQRIADVAALQAARAATDEAVKAVEARVVELQRGLRVYGVHLVGCQPLFDPKRPCTCGLHALLTVPEPSAEDVRGIAMSAFEEALQCTMDEDATPTQPQRGEGEEDSQC